VRRVDEHGLHRPRSCARAHTIKSDTASPAPSRTRSVVAPIRQLSALRFWNSDPVTVTVVVPL